MPVYNVNCPNCGLILFSEYYKPGSLEYFGRTIDNCPKCGNKVTLKWNYEWENLTPHQKKLVLCFGFGITLDQNPDKFFSLCKLNRNGMQKWREFKFDDSMLENPKIKESIERTKDQEYRNQLLLLGRTFYGTRI